MISSVGLKIIMRVLLVFALILLAKAAYAAEPAVEIEFEYAPSFQDETLVYLARLPDGRIHCEVLTRPELGEEQSEREWKRVKEVGIAPEVFARLEREFDTLELKRAGERDWPPMPDGSRWRLKKKKGAFAVEIVAYNPDIEPEGAPIVRLASAISEASSAGLFPNAEEGPIG